jgi:lysophospholipase L1-like esterase
VPFVFFLILELALRISPWDERLGPHRFDGGLEDHSLFWDPDNIIKIPVDEIRVKVEFRGKKISVEKPPNIYRIICLGGSFTYGWPYDKNPSIAYPAVLEKLLNSIPSNREYEVINAGVGGYTSYQALFYFKNRLYKLKPDLVTVCFGANDGNKNYEIGVFCSDKDYYERLMSLSENKTFFKIKRCLDNLRIYALMEKIIFNIKKQFIKPKQRVPPSDFEKNLREFIRLAKFYNFKLLFIIEPHKNLKNFVSELKNNPYYNIYDTLAKENLEWVKLVDTITLVRKYKDGDIFYDEMHLTPLGHRIVAELILQVLEKSSFFN